MSDALDNPIWNALNSEQVHFAERLGDAARFVPEVTNLAGLRVPEPAAIADLARLVRPGEVTGMLVDAPLALPAVLVPIEEWPVLQMVHDGGDPPVEPDGLEELGPADGPAMLALAEATRPGPFGTRTAELGTFLGVRDRGRLIAMAGERMRLPGLIEVSGVCTDPAHLGRGHAARLLAGLLARILGGGRGAFLHVLDSNARAIGLYQRLGFRSRRGFRYLITRRTNA